LGKSQFGRRKLSAAEIVELRKKWKGEFEPRIWEWHQKKLREDVIIRDMKRFDSYPDLDEKAKGISPWFRAGLVGTYHRGIQVGLSWDTLTKHGKDDRWRRTNYKAGETGDIKVLRMLATTRKRRRCTAFRFIPKSHLTTAFAGLLKDSAVRAERRGDRRWGTSSVI
jgi:hypothetical protein